MLLRLRFPEPSFGFASVPQTYNIRARFDSGAKPAALIWNTNTNTSTTAIARAVPTIEIKLTSGASFSCSIACFTNCLYILSCFY